MSKTKFLIVGAGGRESSFAVKLMEDSAVYAVIDHENPTIIDAAKQSGGAYLIGDSSNPDIVTQFALQQSVDYVFVSSDNPLANGVVDELLKHSIKAIGGTKEATRIEWDKVYSIEMMQEICPQQTPFFIVVSHKEELEEAIRSFKERNLEIVVKPQGLTGGKGVKVMPLHLPTYDACGEYAEQLLQDRQNEKVLLVEKIKGLEFTIMGITDGKNLVLSPASYDYPFRYEGDTGPGTGGMGCFTDAGKKLPFMSEDDLTTCQDIMQKIINKMKEDGLFFNGVLNGGFFKSDNGIQFMEFNGRFGDPEGINVLSVMDSSFSELLKDIWHQRLNESSVKFLNKASVVKYLVAKDYPNPSPESIRYTFDFKQAESMGVTVLAAHTRRVARRAAEEMDDSLSWETLKRSRVLAVVAVSDNIAEASELVNLAIEECLQGDLQEEFQEKFQEKLEYRKDIGIFYPELK